MKILALDPGTRRVGLAACDELGISTRLLPVLNFKSTGHLVQSILPLIRQEEFEKLIIGLPLNMDGSVGEAAQRSQNLAASFEKEIKRSRLDCEVVLWDERLTSFEAELRLREKSVAKKKAKTYLDSLAAEVLLQDYLASQT